MTTSTPMNDAERTTDPARLAERLDEGRWTVCLGAVPVPIGTRPLARIVRVSCDVPRETYGPLLALVERVGFVLGERDAGASHPLLEQARSHVFDLGRRALGDRVAPRSALGDVVATLNRLAETRATIVLDAVDLADDATLEALARVVAKPGWLKVPVVLGARTRSPSGAFGDLVAAIAAAEGDRAIVRFAAPDARSVVPATALPSETRTVLRAASVLGPAFEIDLLASVVDVDPLEILSHLQEARDLGVHVEDRGDGTFALDPDQLAVLDAGMLPTLRALFHRRAAEGVRPSPADGRDAEPSATEDVPPLPRVVAPSPASPRVPPEAPSSLGVAEARSSNAERSDAAEGGRPMAQETTSVRGTSDVRDDEEEEEEADGAPRETPTLRVGPRTPSREAQQSRDHARAEQHYVAAGDALRAIEQTILAGAKASRLGAHAQAEALVTRALTAARDLPADDAGRALHVGALLELGRVRLEGFVSGAGARFVLESALEPLEAAQRLITERDAPEVHVRSARLLAEAYAARGDAPSLDRALEALVDASRRLVARGEARHATRLLNDQAAIYLKMGDPVRAMAHLERSRQLFESKADTDPTALEETADTDHLIARVPLHVAARPGHEDDALSRALDHAIAARRTYRRLGDKRSVARVEETIGRLEIARGRLDRALEALKSALRTQEELRDLVGLARTTAALGDALARGGRLDDALALLSESIRMNRAKGSLAGIAYNRRALEGLGDAALHGASPARVAEALTELEEAERHLGAIHLPDSPAPSGPAR